MIQSHQKLFCPELGGDDGNQRASERVPLRFHYSRRHQTTTTTTANFHFVSEYSVLEYAYEAGWACRIGRIGRIGRVDRIGQQHKWFGPIVGCLFGRFSRPTSSLVVSLLLWLAVLLAVTVAHHLAKCAQMAHHTGEWPVEKVQVLLLLRLTSATDQPSQCESLCEADSVRELRRTLSQN